MRKVIPLSLLLALGGVIFLAIRQHNEVADARRQNIALQQQVADARQTHDAALESLRQQAEQLQKLQNEKDEAIRLRGDVTRLRQQLKQKESELANRPAFRPANSVPTEDAATQPPVESFRAVVQARLAWDQTLVTGGWKTQEGKHTFVFVDATKIPNEGPLQLDLRTKYLVLPDELLAKHGLAGLVSDQNESSRQSVMTQEQMLALFESLKNQPGVDLLSAPTITTMDGREAQIKSVDVFKDPEGREFELGPRVSITPKVTAPGDYIDLGVIAELNHRSK